MKILVNIARIVVGLLFIFSGLVKANDPLGLSYKMQEFFEIWGMTKFNDTTLWLSVLMNAFEIIAGFTILLGWWTRLFTWLLLLLIIFFTFLTGYTYYTGKPHNCGCFGDCLPISSGTSFSKDVVLTILILFLFFARKHITPLFGVRGRSNGTAAAVRGRGNTTSALVMVLVVIAAFGFQWYTLRYLPIVDCLPFKKGNNITRKMMNPPGSVPDSFAIRFMYEKGGKKFEFSPADFPADLGTYNYVSRVDKLIREGNAEPPIKGFALTGLSGEDSTTVVLDQPEALILFLPDFSVSMKDWAPAFTGIWNKATGKGVPVYVIASSKETAKVEFAPFAFAGVQVFSCDNTTIRTAARTNPCLYLLRKGTVIAKEGHHRFDRILGIL